MVTRKFRISLIIAAVILFVMLAGRCASVLGSRHKTENSPEGQPPSSLRTSPVPEKYWYRVGPSGIRVKAERESQKVEMQNNIISYRLRSKDRAKQIQTVLKKAGFYKGNIDGKLGPQTKESIKAFQKSKGLSPDGVIGIKTWRELNKLLKE